MYLYLVVTHMGKCSLTHICRSPVINMHFQQNVHNHVTGHNCAHSTDRTYLPSLPRQSCQAPYTCVRLVKFLGPINFPMLNSMNQSECSVPRIVSLKYLSLFVSSCMSLGRAQSQQNGTGWNYPNH